MSDKLFQQSYMKTEQAIYDNKFKYGLLWWFIYQGSDYHFIDLYKLSEDELIQELIRLLEIQIDIYENKQYGHEHFNFHYINDVYWFNRKDLSVQGIKDISQELFDKFVGMKNQQREDLYSRALCLAADRVLRNFSMIYKLEDFQIYKSVNKFLCSNILH